MNRRRKTRAVSTPHELGEVRRTLDARHHLRVPDFYPATNLSISQSVKSVCAGHRGDAWTATHLTYFSKRVDSSEIIGMGRVRNCHQATGAPLAK